jgi:hypothetical protein
VRMRSNGDGALANLKPICLLPGMFGSRTRTQASLPSVCVSRGSQQQQQQQ